MVPDTYDNIKKYYLNKIISMVTKFRVMDNNTEAVVVMLHGLDGSSDQFTTYTNKLLNKNIRCIVPEILNKGNDLLKECGDDVYTKIKNILSMVVKLNIPLFIIGYSNGGRIALYLYLKLMNEYKEFRNKIYVSTIATPIKGTLMANYALEHKWYQSKIHTYPNAYSALVELCYENETSINILNSCLNYDSFKINTKFYASTCDTVVYPVECAIVTECDNIIIDDIDHNSIFLHCHNDQISWIIRMMNKN